MHSPSGHIESAAGLFDNHTNEARMRVRSPDVAVAGRRTPPRGESPKPLPSRPANQRQ
jgi:hypothetical protein